MTDSILCEKTEKIKILTRRKFVNARSVPNHAPHKKQSKKIIVVRLLRDFSTIFLCGRMFTGGNHTPKCTDLQEAAPEK
ncbi:MAG: hypothetical protein SFX18_16865 [Pirellulales bacterium]|nr:hypothetical protein [Pirellulales bacterium]